MAHDIDITNGIASFADSRTDDQGHVDAWHKLGTPVGHTMTVDEALDAAHMRGWNVRKEPLTAIIPTADGDTREVAVPDKFLTLRTNPHTGEPEPLGVVGNHWTPFQNEQTTALLSDITEASGGHIETIGALNGGRRTFVTMRMPSWMDFTSPTGVTDRTDLYLNVFNRHDGRGALVAQISPVRVVCANTQRLAETLAESRVAIQHTGNPAARMAEVRHLLGLTFAFRDTYVEQCEALIARELDNVKVMDVISVVWGVKAATTERQADARKAAVADVMAVYDSSPNMAGFRGTAMGAYNAVTEYLDHYRTVPGASKMDDEEIVLRRAQAVATSSTIADTKARAFSALLAV